VPGRGVVLASTSTGEKKTASAPVVEPQKRSAPPALPQRTPVPNTPQAVGITVTNKDSFPDHTNGSKAIAGDTITYSVAITNTTAANITATCWLAACQLT